VIALFAYGTLRDAEYQRALFDRTPAMQPATLAGWRPVVAESGYLTIVRAPGECVNGDVVLLDEHELAIADGWEEVPLYERVSIEARALDGAPIACWVYVRATALHERAPAGRLAGRPRAEVLARIRAYRATCE
jgi:gamma-glutamylcyclotransferase (GGCT)/AIG2-like uncharacterized protein YtfP